MHRPAQRLTRILACAAAVPVILAASGCSSDSGSGDGAKTGSDPKSSSSSSATGGGAGSKVKPAAYSTLPDPCRTVTKKTLGDLVPEGTTSGKQGQSDDTSTRGTCSWNSLDNNGVKGSQFRWLNVSLLRFDSDASRGSGDKLAGRYFAKQVSEAQASNGAKNVKTGPVSGTGDEATAVRYDLKKKEGAFKQQTIVARVQNIVVTVDYNGAGLAGDKTPNADDLVKSAEKAAKEAVAAVVAANDGKAGKGDTSSSKPSDKASKSST